MSKRFLRIANGFVSFLTALILMTALLYSGYAIWDNGQIYAAAEDVMEEARTIRDQTSLDEEPETELQAMFRKLHEINPDICAWVTMYGTSIDYPVVHSSNNIDYVSTDIYGNFAIVGSIFMDFRNTGDSTDPYILLYGHNMSKNRMFSDVNLYKEQEYFDENQLGAYYTEEGAHWLQTISVILTHAGDSAVFNPTPWENLSNDTILELVQKNAVFVNETGLEALQAKIEAEEEIHILALSTCSTEFTDARTILLTLIDPDLPKQ